VTPDGIGEEFELGGGWPVADLACVPGMRAEHFLQKHEIHIGFTQQVPDLVQDKIAIAARESLMDVVGK
jgi:hypothetical protein